MRILLLAVVAILVLGGGGAGAYFYFGQKAEAAVDPTGEHEAKAEKAEKKGGHGEKGEGAAKTEFVELDPLILPIIDEKGINQVVSLVIVLEVPDEAKKEEVTALIPRLTDAYIQALYGVLNRHAAIKDGVVQVGMVKERLNEISQHVLGDGMVEDVLLQVVQQRPM